MMTNAAGIGRIGKGTTSVVPSKTPKDAALAAEGCTSILLKVGEF